MGRENSSSTGHKSCGNVHAKAICRLGCLMLSNDLLERILFRVTFAILFDSRTSRKQVVLKSVGKDED